MENIVYFLGAGFSAPIGIPVMNDFYMESKNVYKSNTKQYKHFQEIFTDIDKLNKIKNYYESDLFNIEEILSIFEMWEYLSSGKKVAKFQQYILDVIKFYTPIISAIKAKNPAFNWYDFIWGKEEKWKRYGWFIANLLKLRINTKPRGEEGDKIYFSYDQDKAAKIHYGVVTLNYDLIFETIFKYIDDHWVNMTIHKTEEMEFTNSENTKLNRFLMAKIHGSIDNPSSIILPTWRKGVKSDEDVLFEWKKAYELIANATQIRILGYSFPETDYYVRYLFKSAILRSANLRRIDMICLDPTGKVKERHDGFIKFKYSRFIDANIEDYFDNIMKEEKENI
jgi:SIR2-like domain